MSIEQIGAYSPEVVYGQFTSPFTPPKVKINSHTDYDKEEEKTTESEASRIHDFLEKKPAKLKIEIEKNEEKNTYGIENEDFPPDYLKTKQEKVEFPPKNVPNFSKSELSSKDIVSNAMKKGYTSEEAVVIDNAKKAYEKSILHSKHPARTLSKHEYTVS